MWALNIIQDCKLAPWYRAGEWGYETLEWGFPEYPIARFRIEYDEVDSDDGKTMQRQLGRWWYIEPDFTREAIIKAAYLAITVSDEHRRREGFLYNKATPFNPHTHLYIGPHTSYDFDMPLGERIGG